VFRFPGRADSATAVLTYADLDREAGAIAELLEQIARPGDRILLAFPPGPELPVAFLGCLYARMIAVLVPPPLPARWDRFMARTLPVLRDASPAAGLTTEAVAELIARAPPTEGLAIPWIVPAHGASGTGGAWNRVVPRSEELAFLQYTSGSTGEPRGVMVTHGNLMHNLGLISAAFATGSGDRTSVFWLPPYHDMGLIGGILAPILVGSPATIIPPEAFIQRPVRWLQAISDTGARVSGGPSFAYDLCLRKTTAEQLARLDLSSWEVAFNGAEPVDPETLRAFARHVAPAGFDPRAFRPCYGLAESTLFVSSSSRGVLPTIRAFRKPDLAENVATACSDDEPGTKSLVSCGPPAVPVRIVDPDALTVCAGGCIGEIWVTGPSVAAGYWNREADTEATFAARIQETGAEPWLRTGDLGFLLDGDLFVTGRLKDLIIIDGQNRYPQDLERSIQGCLPVSVLPECTAFSVDREGREELVIVAAYRTGMDLDTVRREIRAVLSTHHDLRASEIVLVKPGQIPRTPTGKLRRRACRDRYLAGVLESVSGP
jgi:acyl-CoA synthetase (AMP-forming)/AMP-acid ligase II